MSKVPLSIPLILLWIHGGVWAGNSPDDCFSAMEITRGKVCLSENSIGIVFANTCDKPMDLKWCLELTKGTWSCGMVQAVKPGETSGSDAWECNATGRFKIWGRTRGSGVQFPEIEGIFRQDADKLYALAYGESPEAACRRAKDGVTPLADCECEPMGKRDKYRCRVEVQRPKHFSGRAIQFRPHEFTSAVRPATTGGAGVTAPTAGDGK